MAWESLKEYASATCQVDVLVQKRREKHAVLLATVTGVCGRRVPNLATEGRNLDQENVCTQPRLENNAPANHSSRKAAILVSAKNGSNGRSGQHVNTQVEQMNVDKDQNFDHENALVRLELLDAKVILTKKLHAKRDLASGPIGNSLVPALLLVARDRQVSSGRVRKKGSVMALQQRRELASKRSALDGSPGLSGASALSPVEVVAKQKLEPATDGFTTTAGVLWSK